MAMLSVARVSCINDKLYSPQMVVTANTTKYTIENDLTKKEKKEEKTNIFIV